MVYLKNPGLRDWWIQRITSPLITIAFLPLIIMWLMGYLPTPYDWYVLLSEPMWRMLTLVGFLAYYFHVRIGLWVVLTDYIPRTYQVYATFLGELLLLAHLVVGLYLIWSF